MSRFIERGTVEKLVPKQRRSARNLRIWRIGGRIVFEYEWEGVTKRISLGIGGYVDLASTNWFFRFLIDLFTGGMARRAFALHDIGCQCHDLDKREVDHILNEAMRAAEVPGWMRERIYASVRGSEIRNNWPQPEYKPVLREDGLPGMFAEVTVEVVEAE